ncbi:hypothetical protein H8959_011711 [Pygathrix nigripes]
MAGELTPEQEAQYKQAFSTVDTDGNGTINAQELGAALKAMGRNFSEAELKKLISQFDSDGDGEISFEEFMAAVKKARAGLEDLQVAFRAFDQDGDGHITVDELKQAMAGLGQPLPQEELDAMIREADVDQDGRVNYEEFARMLAQDCALSLQGRRPLLLLCWDSPGKPGRWMGNCLPREEGFALQGLDAAPSAACEPLSASRRWAEGGLLGPGPPLPCSGMGFPSSGLP